MIIEILHPRPVNWNGPNYLVVDVVYSSVVERATLRMTRLADTATPTTRLDPPLEA